MKNIQTISTLATLLAEKTPYTQDFCQLFIGEVFKSISAGLKESGIVKVKGLGTFTFKEGGEIFFEADKKVGKIINEPFGFFEPVELEEGASEDFDTNLVAENDIKEDEIEADDIVSETPEVDKEKTQEEEVDSASAIILPPPPVINRAPENDIAMEDKAEDSSEESDCISENDLTEEESYENNAFSSADGEIEEKSENNYDFTENQPTDDLEDKEEKHGSSKFIPGLVVGLVIGVIIGAVSVILLRGDGFNFISQNNKEEVDGAIQQSGYNAENNDIKELEQPLIEEESTVLVEEPVIVTDTVRANYYLAGMARKHYNHYEYWVYIYEENADHLGHPDRVELKTVVTIPDLTTYGILDKDDPANIAKANKKVPEIYKKFAK